MFSTQLARPGRQFWAAAARRAVCPRSSQLLSQTQPRQRALVIGPSISRRVRYSTTPALFRKFEDHHNHPNINKAASSPALDTDAKSEDRDDDRLLSDVDDLMVGNEGIEAIDPKDFPELYPGEEDIEGIRQGYDSDSEPESETTKSASVLLSDKDRSEEEFSWFVDDSFPDKAAGQQPQAGSTSDFVPLWQKNAQRSPGEAVDGHKDDHVEEHHADSISGLVKLMESERARNIKVIDMRDKCDWTDWMVIAEGLSERHLGNVADQVYSALKKSSPHTSPPVMEGRDTSDWVVIDAGSVVIHFMTPEARKERDLEGLWASVKNPLKLKDAEELSWDDVKGKMTKSWKENPGRSRGEDGKRGRRGERDIPLSEVVKW